VSEKRNKKRNKAKNRKRYAKMDCGESRSEQEYRYEGSGKNSEGNAEKKWSVCGRDVIHEEKGAGSNDKK
jgi:hypothetical protein